MNIDIHIYIYIHTYHCGIDFTGKSEIVYSLKQQLETLRGTIMINHGIGRAPYFSDKPTWVSYLKTRYH